jgi:hypothetical protein
VCRDLADIYGVTTGRFNGAVNRNIKRFPEDFMLRLSAAEYAALISQSATSKPRRGGRRKLPWAFTEHGAIQAANVLNSACAIAMGVYVVRCRYCCHNVTNTYTRAITVKPTCPRRE